MKRAKAEGYRSRAAYKLIELDERFGFLRGAKRVVDLGIAPGGWAQVVRRRLPKAAIVGIDLLPVDPIDGVTILQMDFMDDAAPDALIEALGGAPDLVLSDMAANTVGHPQTDRCARWGWSRRRSTSRSMCWSRAARSSPRCFAGGADAALVAELKRNFTTVKHAKPPASRKGSSEWYVVAQGFKGRTGSGVRAIRRHAGHVPASDFVHWRGCVRFVARMRSAGTSPG